MLGYPKALGCLKTSKLASCWLDVMLCMQNSSHFIGFCIVRTHPLFHGFLPFEMAPSWINHRGEGSPTVVRPKMGPPILQKSIEKLVSTLSRVSRSHNTDCTLSVTALSRMASMGNKEVVSSDLGNPVEWTHLAIGLRWLSIHSHVPCVQPALVS